MNIAPAGLGHLSMANMAQSAAQLSQYPPNVQACDNTDLEVILGSMKDRVLHGRDINERLSRLVIKLCGSLPPSGEGGTAATPNGLIADLQDITATLGSTQATTMDLIGRLASVI